MPKKILHDIKTDIAKINVMVDRLVDHLQDMRYAVNEISILSNQLAALVL